MAASCAIGVNRVWLVGTVDGVRRRWLPSGEPAVIAALLLERPDVGPARAGVERQQPLPLRATGAQARALAGLDGSRVEIRGYLRRRYYRREGQPHWGQVEIWVEACRPLSEPLMPTPCEEGGIDRTIASNANDG